MYKILIYSKLNNNQKILINNFILLNFNINNESNLVMTNNTIIILYILDNTIISCVCFLNNKFLKEKLDIMKISYKGYNINENKSGLFLYNFCVNKDYRKKNYGNILIKYSLEIIKNLKVDYIHCQAENEISKNIFNKNDFVVIKKFKTDSNKLIYLMTKLL